MRQKTGIRMHYSFRNYSTLFGFQRKETEYCITTALFDWIIITQWVSPCSKLTIETTEQ